jgi:hypothetical protein
MEARVNWLQDPLPLPADRPAAWMQNLVTVEIESGSVRAAVSERMMAGDVGHVIHGLADEPDVTVTVSGSHPAAGKVMIAASGGNYFLGLLSPDGGVYQYAVAAGEQLGARTTFTIQGEVTEIGSRWVADAGTAAAAVREWLAAGHEAAPSDNWVKM